MTKSRLISLLEKLCTIWGRKKPEIKVQPQYETPPAFVEEPFVHFEEIQVEEHNQYAAKSQTIDEKAEEHKNYVLSLTPGEKEVIMDCKTLYKGIYPQMITELLLVGKKAQEAGKDIGFLVQKLNNAEALSKYQHKHNVCLYVLLEKYDPNTVKDYKQKTPRPGFLRAAALLL